MTSTKTPKEWIQTPEKDLGVAFGEALTPEPWEHKLVVDPNKFGSTLVDLCAKCKEKVPILENDIFPFPKSYGQFASDGCSVSDPVDFKDWNVAKYYQKQCFEGDFERSMRRVHHALGETGRTSFGRWFKYHALSKHYLMAAVLSGKRVKDRDEEERRSAV